ncbi:hypothetical protein [Streptomyces sp. I05A-00742]|uniref:hypothetical protein n=1 Tax=Streptomyces sp. I05A-00742 TaxID=2732853 RepID=UPI001487A97B|nr:hypothetical protein [Streptomyces sp. I05A-00742]
MTAAADLVNRAEPHEDFDGLKSACMAAGRAIQFSCAVVELEGPVPVAELAGRVYEGIISLQLRANEAALVERAIHILRAVENEQGLAGIDLDDVLDAWDALHDLSTAARAQATAGSYPIRTAGARNAVLAEAAARALTTLASCGVVGDGASSLINDARQGLAPDNRQNAFHEAGTEVQRRLATWIEAARVYLDSDGLA